MSANTAVKAAPAIPLKDWVENVRTLAPEARVPYIIQIMAEAYDAGLLRSSSWMRCPNTNFPMRTGSKTGRSGLRNKNTPARTGAENKPFPRHFRGPLILTDSGGNPVAISFLFFCQRAKCAYFRGLAGLAQW